MSPSRVAGGRGLWWLSPVGVVLLVVPVSLLLAVSTSDAGFRLLYRTPKVLTSGQALLFLAAAAAMLLGVLLTVPGRQAPWPSPWPVLRAEQVRILRRAANVCFWTTVLGYVTYLAAAGARGLSPADLQAILFSQENYSGALREVFAPVTGITTLTQVGIAYVVLGGLLLISGNGQGVRRRLTVVVLLGLARAFFLTERLALIEVVVPLAVLAAAGLRQQRHRPGSQWLPFAPVLAVPALVAVFGLFEYSRSWVFFRTRTTSTFPEFVLDRLAGYYATAYNNGAIQLVHTPDDGRLPYSSLEALWTAPVVAQLDVYQRLTGLDAPTEYAVLLEQHGTPEFNNPGGLAVPLTDFGLAGGLLAFLVAGLLVGLAYRSFRNGSPTGLLLYPVVFTGLLEMPRYLYWTQGRVVPPVLALVVTAVLVHRAGPPVGAIPVQLLAQRERARS